MHAGEFPDGSSTLVAKIDQASGNLNTLSGIRWRGYTPESLRNFCAAIGVSKTNGIIELAMLEHYLREDLNKRALRVMAVLRPLKLVIDNYPEGQMEEMEAINNPEDA